MARFDRRDFLRASASASGLLALAAADGSLLADEKPDDAGKRGDVNSQLRVAVIGVRGQGAGHVSAYAGNKKMNTVVTHICDVDEGVIGKAMKTVEDKQGAAPTYVKDIRKLLENKEIDLVSIATPNHWHALASIWAMQAGKDVYVEKPVSHNVKEGRMIVEFARKLDRICQTGTQSRSQKGMREAIEYVHGGKIGKVSLARGLCYKPRGSIGKVTAPTEPPKTCDYDIWCGPAPMKPLMRAKLHYDWHWAWDTGNGDLGNQGIHEMDKARWGLGKPGLPRSVQSIGGRFGYVDDGETANTQIIVCEYDDAELIFEVRGLATPDLKGAKVGNIFYGSDGYVVCPNYSSGIAYDKEGTKVAEFKGGGDHFENFVKAVRARDHKLLNADILEGHLSSALCHLGNISYRLGKPMSFEHAEKAFGEDAEAHDSVKRMLEHLKDNNLALGTTKYRHGPKLAIDPASEKFIGDAKAANDMLFREYRKGFEVPAKV